MKPGHALYSLCISTGHEGKVMALYSQMEPMQAVAFAYITEKYP